MKVLVAGESWTTFSTHVKGADSFTTSKYATGIEPLRTTLRGFGHEVVHMPAELVPDSFPATTAELGAYDVVILSDIGSNSFYLSTETFERSASRPDRLEMLRQWVAAGGALVMVGGYMSYSGIEAKARFGRGALADCLPVLISDFDDRAERPAGVRARVDLPGHPLAAGLQEPWPSLLGYNQVAAREEAAVVATVEDGIPLLVTWDYGEGRTTAFTSECAPHWAPPEFLSWPGYATLWNNIVTWTAARPTGQAKAASANTTSVLSGATRPRLDSHGGVSARWRCATSGAPARKAGYRHTLSRGIPPGRDAGLCYRDSRGRDARTVPPSGRPEGRSIR